MVPMVAMEEPMPRRRWWTLSLLFLVVVIVVVVFSVSRCFQARIYIYIIQICEVKFLSPLSKVIGGVDPTIRQLFHYLYRAISNLADGLEMLSNLNFSCLHLDPGGKLPFKENMRQSKKCR